MRCLICISSSSKFISRRYLHVLHYRHLFHMFIITMHYRHNPLKWYTTRVLTLPQQQKCISNSFANHSNSIIFNTQLLPFVTGVYLLQFCYLYNALTLRDGGIYNDTVSISDDIIMIPHTLLIQYVSVDIHMQGCYIIHNGIWYTALLQLMTLSYSIFNS